MLSTLRSIRVLGQYRSCKSILSIMLLIFMDIVVTPVSQHFRNCTHVQFYRVLLTCIYII